MVDGGKGRNEEKGKLIEWVGKKGGRELKDEERDGMLACLWMGGEEKKGKGSIQFFARHGEGRSESQGRLVQLLLFWSCWGSEQRKGPRPETTPEQKRYRPRVLETIGDDRLGRQFSTKSQFPGCRGLGFRGVRGTGTLRGIPVDPSGTITGGKPRLMQGGQLCAPQLPPQQAPAASAGSQRRPAPQQHGMNAARFFQPSSVSTQNCQLYTRSSSPLQTIVLAHAIQSSKWSKRLTILECFGLLYTSVLCPVAWECPVLHCLLFTPPTQVGLPQYSSRLPV